MTDGNTSDAGIRLITMPGLDAGRRQFLTVDPGTTIAAMVAKGLPGLPADMRRHVRVTINGDVILDANWARVRPKSGTSVVIRVVPAGGALRSILALVVTVAAIVFAPYLVAAVLPGLVPGSFGAALATGLAAGAVASAGDMTVTRISA